MSRFQKLAQLCVTVLVVVNLLAFGGKEIVRRRSAITSQVIDRKSFPPLSGVSRNGVLVNTDVKSGRPCHLIRYASKSCKWCSMDSGNWQSLATFFSRKGCDVFVLAPSSDLMPPPNGEGIPEIQVAFVPFGAFGELRGTPTTVLLDRSWQVLWGHKGAMDPQILGKVRALQIP